jgi:hypothetical protein
MQTDMALRAKREASPEGFGPKQLVLKVGEEGFWGSLVFRLDRAESSGKLIIMINETNPWCVVAGAVRDFVGGTSLKIGKVGKNRVVICSA